VVTMCSSVLELLKPCLVGRDLDLKFAKSGLLVSSMIL